MGNSSRSSSSSLNRPQAAMQRILHSYLQSACHPFQHRERWIVCEVRGSHLCTQENASSHSFQWSRRDILYASCLSFFVQLIEGVFCSWQERQRDSLNLCIICLYSCTLVSNAAFRRCVYCNHTCTGVLLCSDTFLPV